MSHAEVMKRNARKATAYVTKSRTKNSSGVIRERASLEAANSTSGTKIFETCEPGHFTAFGVAGLEGSAGFDDCWETDDDDAAEKDSSMLCAGAAAIRAGENCGVRRSGSKTLNIVKFSNEMILAKTFV